MDNLFDKTILDLPCMRVSRSCCSGGRYCLRKGMIWGTHLPGAWTILDVKVWNRTTTDRCRSMAASVSWDSCSSRAWRWLNISCLKGQRNTLKTSIQKMCYKNTIHSKHQYRENDCYMYMEFALTTKSVPPYLKLTKYNNLCL